MRQQQHLHLAAPPAGFCWGQGQLLELLGAVSLGGWRREAAEEEEAGGKAANSEYAYTDAFVACPATYRLVFQLLSRHRHHRPTLG